MIPKIQTKWKITLLTLVLAITGLAQSPLFASVRTRGARGQAASRRVTGGTGRRPIVVAPQADSKVLAEMTIVEAEGFTKVLPKRLQALQEKSATISDYINLNEEVAQNAIKLSDIENDKKTYNSLDPREQTKLTELQQSLAESMTDISGIIDALKLSREQAPQQAQMPASRIPAPSRRLGQQEDPAMTPRDYTPRVGGDRGSRITSGEPLVSPGLGRSNIPVSARHRGKPPVFTPRRLPQPRAQQTQVDPAQQETIQNVQRFVNTIDKKNLQNLRDLSSHQLADLHTDVLTNQTMLGTISSPETLTPTQQVTRESLQTFLQSKANELSNLQQHAQAQERAAAAEAAAPSPKTLASKASEEYQYILREILTFAEGINEGGISNMNASQLSTLQQEITDSLNTLQTITPDLRSSPELKTQADTLSKLLNTIHNEVLDTIENQLTLEEEEEEEEKIHEKQSLDVSTLGLTEEMQRILSITMENSERARAFAQATQRSLLRWLSTPVTSETKRAQSLEHMSPHKALRSLDELAYAQGLFVPLSEEILQNNQIDRHKVSVTSLALQALITLTLEAINKAKNSPQGEKIIHILQQWVRSFESNRAILMQTASQNQPERPTVRVSKNPAMRQATPSLLDILDEYNTALTEVAYSDDTNRQQMLTQYQHILSEPLAYTDEQIARIYKNNLQRAKRVNTYVFPNHFNQKVEKIINYCNTSRDCSPQMIQALTISSETVKSLSPALKKRIEDLEQQRVSHSVPSELESRYVSEGSED